MKVDQLLFPFVPHEDYEGAMVLFGIVAGEGIRRSNCFRIQRESLAWERRENPRMDLDLDNHVHVASLHDLSLYT